MVEDPDNKLKNDKKFNLKHFRTFADAVLTSVPVLFNGFVSPAGSWRPSI